MTEKIKRRGIRMPESYRPDMLELSKVSEYMSPIDSNLFPVRHDLFVKEARDLALKEGLQYEGRSIIAVSDDALLGFIDKKALFRDDNNTSARITDIINSKVYSVYADKPLDMALELMLRKNQHLLPVIDRTTKKMTGVITERDILTVFEKRFNEDKHIQQHISLRQKAKQAARLVGGRNR